MIIPGVQPELHPRMGFSEGFEDPRQPMHRHAGKRCHHNGSPFPAPEGSAKLLDPFLGFQKSFDFRQEQLSLLRQPDPRAAAAQEGHPQLLFQAGDHLAHGGLRAAQRLRSPAETPAVHRLHKETIALQIHLILFFQVNRKISLQFLPFSFIIASLKGFAYIIY